MSGLWTPFFSGNGGYPGFPMQMTEDSATPGASGTRIKFSSLADWHYFFWRRKNLILETNAPRPTYQVTISEVEWDGFEYVQIDEFQLQEEITNSIELVRESVDEREVCAENAFTRFRTFGGESPFESLDGFVYRLSDNIILRMNLDMVYDSEIAPLPVILGDGVEVNYFGNMEIAWDSKQLSTVKPVEGINFPSSPSIGFTGYVVVGSSFGLFPFVQQTLSSTGDTVADCFELRSSLGKVRYADDIFAIGFPVDFGSPIADDEHQHFQYASPQRFWSPSGSDRQGDANANGNLDIYGLDGVRIRDPLTGVAV